MANLLRRKTLLLLTFIGLTFTLIVLASINQSNSPASNSLLTNYAKTSRSIATYNAGIELTLDSVSPEIRPTVKPIRTDLIERETSWALTNQADYQTSWAPYTVSPTPGGSPTIPPIFLTLTAFLATPH